MVKDRTLVEKIAVKLYEQWADILQYDADISLVDYPTWKELDDLSRAKHLDRAHQIIEVINSA